MTTNFLTASGKINRSVVFDYAWTGCREDFRRDPAHGLRRFDIRLPVAWALAREQKARFGLTERECQIRDLESEIRAADYIDSWRERNRVVAACKARIAELKAEG